MVTALDPVLASRPMTGALKSVREVFPEAESFVISQRAAVGVGGVGGWFAIRSGRGWIAARECFGTWYAPLPRALRSAGVHTSYALTLDDLQTPVYRTARAALESVLDPR